MTELTFNKLGLKHGYSLGEDGWGPGMEANLLILNHFVQGRVIARQNAAPGGTPTEGDMYIVGTAGSGAFSGHNAAVAVYSAGAWSFFSPQAGWRFWNVATSVYDYYTGTAWAADPAFSAISDAPSDGTDYARKDGAWVTFVPFTNEAVDDRVAALLVAGTGVTLTYNDVANTLTVEATSTTPTEVLAIACSDETTAITTGVAKVTFRMPYAFTVSAVRASLSAASTSGNPQIDINESGVSILSTKLTIDSGETTSTTAATPAVISDTSLADDAEITIDIDTAGTAAKGLKVYIIGHQ